MDHSHASLMARYNRWANTRLYAGAATLADAQRRQPVGLYFKSLHGTLNHLLTADLIWMSRLEGKGGHPGRLDAIVHDDFEALRAAREAEDQRLMAFIARLEPAELARVCSYTTLAGAPHQQPLRDILAHLFNHQTHHRGQAHAALTILGLTEPASLDLLAMQREGHA
jgi:uncharacterized damage-inducible protein DinB